MRRVPQAPSTTQYEAIVLAAAAEMAAMAPCPDKAGVPPEVAAALFPTADDLSVAVIEHAIVRLIDAVTVATVAAAPDDPVAQLQAMCRGFVEWAFDHPDSYTLLIHSPALLYAEERMLGRYNRAFYDLAMQMAERAQAAGRLDADADLAEVLLTLRALTLGIATLASTAQASYWTRPGDDPQAALAASLDAYFALRFAAPV